VCVEIDLFPGPQYRQRDLDNIVKPLLDFLVYRSVLADDSTQHIRRVVVQFQSERLQSNQVRLRIRKASSL
jgi:Holliday junction resolvase RusA-like endonuclease